MVGTDIAELINTKGKIIQVGNANTVFNLPSIIDTSTSAVAGADDPNSTNRVGINYKFVITTSLTSSNTFV